VRDALEEICRLFDARYRIEEDGSITVESGPEKAQAYATRSYLLRSGAFGDANAAQARLIEKGIQFPKGTSAKWNPADRQLAVTHTVETQGRIEELLKQEFGAGYTPLTHWVLLMNGGRLGLAVERFEKDFIRGHHPEYGRCQVPMPLVFSLQTSKPAPSDSMRSLASWHLIPAVEPVIPGSGGESSPTLGKEAATFKLPLLAGGDFDLKADRGKIVVLDFWATWCAPCIKSIPGLIEAIGTFPKEQVKLIGVNQGESAEAVKRFIETRQWQFTVAMDADQKVAQQYGVSGIPHTVIVGPDGKVAWVKTGFSPEGAAEAAQAIKTLLSAAPAAATDASGK
jgi:peroxiredoxin